MSGTTSEFWIQLDESDDVAGSVRHCIAALILARQDHAAWKWVVLSLHAALQGACVCHLTTTANPVGALTDKSTLEWLSYFELSRENDNINRPKTVLAPLPNLLKRIRKPDSAGDHSQGSAVGLSDVELRWLTHLHDEVRNQFVHFEPMGWSLDVSGLSSLIGIVCRILSDISSKRWAFRHEDAAWHKAFDDDLLNLVDVSSQLFSDIAAQQKPSL